MVAAGAEASQVELGDHRREGEGAEHLHGHGHGPRGGMEGLGGQEGRDQPAVRR